MLPFRLLNSISLLRKQKMLKRKYAILAGAIASGLPVVGHAAMVTIGFDLADITVASTSAGPYTAASSTSGVTLTGTSAAPVLTVPVGEYINYGLQALVGGTTTGTNLLGATGISAFQTGITDGNAAIATINPVPTVVNTYFSSLHGAGTADATGGGVGNGALAPSGTAGSFIAGNGTITQASNYGVGTAGELYAGQRIKPVTTVNGTDTFTVTDNITALQFLIQTGSSSGSKIYSNRTFITGTDTIAALPVLTVNYGAAVTSGTTHSIISLTAGTTAPAYGTFDGTIAVTGKGNGSYNVTPAAGFTTAATGYSNVSGFNPTTDTEIYALKLSLGGTPLASNDTRLSTIVADINGGGNTGDIAPTGITASLVTGVFSTLFPGYDVLLTSSGFTAGTGGTSELGFDFSSAGDADTATGAVTVTGIAAVPEPATAAGVVLGAAGLLLGRRRKVASLV
jgi:hypothetical protein